MAANVNLFTFPIAPDQITLTVPEDKSISLCMLGNFSFFLFLSADISKKKSSKNSFRNTIRVSNSLDPDQNLPSDDFPARYFFKKFTQKKSADDKIAMFLKHAKFHSKHRAS